MLGNRSGYRRRSARVLLVDGADRLLLMAMRGRAGSVEWLTPGGGVDPGESLVATAARELAEEIGLRVDAAVLGAPVAFTEGWADLSWAKGVFRDDFFYHRVTAHEVDTSGFTEFERRTQIEQRWWTRDELTATSERVHPLALVPLLDRLFTGWLPTEPVQLPWHH